jgi:hypothetical protein
MNKRDSVLDKIIISNPCKTKWQEMQGTDKVRFCDKCNLNVYNLSEMNKKEAEDLIIKTEGKICSRFYRREDGTIITKDCIGRREVIKQKVFSLVKNIALTLVSFMAGIGLYNFINTKKVETLKTFIDTSFTEVKEPKNLIQLKKANNKEQCKVLGPEEGTISIRYVEAKQNPFRQKLKNKILHK